MARLKNRTKIKLSSSQKVAFQRIQNFILDCNQSVFILKGYAGTGKSTIVKEIIDWMDSIEIKYQLLASTGRAAKVLKNKTNNSVSTIHSTIYHFGGIDDDLEEMHKLQTDPKLDDKGHIHLNFDQSVVDVEDAKTYIIDESSMIGDSEQKSSSFAKFGSGKLLSDLIKFDPNGKFIFIGDSCQLPPIGQTISPALNSDYFSSVFNIEAQEFELIEIMRQREDNGIIKSSMKLRKLQESNPQTKWAKLPMKGEKNISFLSHHICLVESYIKNLGQNGFAHSTLICHTNRHCSIINGTVRQSVFKGLDQIQNGDLLLITQNNLITGLVNGDQVLVNSVGKREVRCNLSFLALDVTELISKITYSSLIIEDILNSQMTNISAKQHKDLMIDYYLRMKNKGIMQNSPAFISNMKRDPYLNSLRAVYGYALTCHKAQGGEWNEVYLFLDNKIHGIPKPGIYQWWYTAVTRAKEELHIVNDWFIN